MHWRRRSRAEFGLVFFVISPANFIKKKYNYAKFDQNIWCGSRVMTIFSSRQQPINMLSGQALSPFCLLLDFSLTVKAATLIFISGCGSAIPTAKEGKSGFIYNLVKS